MSKIRVSELAKKLGIDSKDLLEQLNRAGVAAKSHASTLEESDLQKFDAAKAAAHAAASADVKVDERRIGSGLIRRRATRVATPEEETGAPVPASAAVPEPVMAPPPPPPSRPLPPWLMRL